MQSSSSVSRDAQSGQGIPFIAPVFKEKANSVIVESFLELFNSPVWIELREIEKNEEGIEGGMVGTPALPFPLNIENVNLPEPLKPLVKAISEHVGYDISQDPLALAMLVFIVESVSPLYDASKVDGNLSEIDAEIDFIVTLVLAYASAHLGVGPPPPESLDDLPPDVLEFLVSNLERPEVASASDDAEGLPDIPLPKEYEGFAELLSQKVGYSISDNPMASLVLVLGMQATVNYFAAEAQGGRIAAEANFRETKQAEIMQKTIDHVVALRESKKGGLFNKIFKPLIIITAVIATLASFGSASPLVMTFALAALSFQMSLEIDEVTGGKMMKALNETFGEWGTLAFIVGMSLFFMVASGFASAQRVQNMVQNSKFMSFLVKARVGDQPYLVFLKRVEIMSMSVQTGSQMGSSGLAIHKSHFEREAQEAQIDAEELRSEDDLLRFIVQRAQEFFRLFIDHAGKTDKQLSDLLALILTDYVRIARNIR